MSSAYSQPRPDDADRVMRIQVTLKGRPIRTWVLKQETVIIGRSPDADVFLDNPGVSREHLTLKRASDGDYVLQDMGSANGTLLNDNPVTSRRLYDNDVIQIGKFSLLISYEDDPRNREQQGQLNVPSVEDGTMVLSAADLQAVIKKAHEAPKQPVNSPSSNSATPNARRPGIREMAVPIAISFFVGTLLGTGVTLLVLPHLKL